MKCKVSVIIPIYNSEENLDRCIKSASAQTMEDIEVILIDDGSTDNSPAICDKWKEKDAKIKVIHKQNGGVSSARNAGLDIASGEYVCFIDSDDFIEPNMLEKMYGRIKETNADICSCRNFFNETFKKSKIRQNFEMTDIKLGYFNSYYFAEDLVTYSVWGSIYKMEPIKKYKIRFIDYSKVFSEDALFNLMFSCVTLKHTFIEDPLYHYFRHENSLMTSSIPGDYIVRHTNLMIELEDFIKKNNLKIKTGTETACMYWDWVRIACARSKGNAEIVEADFKNASTKKYFKRKIFSFAFGFAAFKYRKYYPMSIGGFVNLKRTAIHLYFNKFNQAIKEYFL